MAIHTVLIVGFITVLWCILIYGIICIFRANLNDDAIQLRKECQDLVKEIEDWKERAMFQASLDSACNELHIIKLKSNLEEKIKELYREREKSERP